MVMKKNFHLSLTGITALLVLLIAVLTGGTLALLRHMHNQAAHTTAAQSVIEKGRMLTADLARQPIVRKANETEQNWNDFSRLVHSLNTVENSLQFVSVRKNGVTIFQEHTVALDGSGNIQEPSTPSLPPEEFHLGRRILNVGKQSIPIVSFSIEVPGDDGVPRVIEVGLRREAVDREEKTTAEALRSMFTLSLITVVVSFVICMLLVVWMMRRESLRERQRHDEEHLAFSGVLANGIVHDFRNPMSSLRLDIQMLQKEAAKGAECQLQRVGDLASRIRNTMDRMDKVFQEFLYLSKPSPERMERIRLDGFVRECAEMLASRLEHAGLRVSLEASQPAPEILGNQSALRRALINVIINAEQFSPKGGEIKIRTGQLTGNGFIDVLDQGPGVARADRKRIFDMFYTTRPQGTGLGLFLARTALEKAGGHIMVMDNPSGGACFRLILPLASEQAEEVKNEQTQSVDY
jgi:signal transduction histidine kinase